MPTPGEDSPNDKGDENGVVIKSPDGDVIIVQTEGPTDDCGVAVDAPDGYSVKPF
jgi:hypothetical protein